MKYLRLSVLPTIISLLLILQGCVTAGQRRQDYIESRPGLSADIKTAILEGRVAEGMTGEDVLASWGEPERKTITYSRGGITELWTYLTPIGHFTSGEVTLTVTNGHLTGLTN